MRDNDRVILIQETLVDDFLDKKIVKKDSQPIPCFRSGMTIAEQMQLFGKYDLDSFKLHLRGKHDGFSEIKYHGKTYQIKGKIHHRNQTVVYL